MDKDVKTVNLLTSDSPEKRGGWFLKAGHGLVFFIVLSFLGIYGLRSYQFDTWKSYFFMGTHNLKDSCAFSAGGSPYRSFPSELKSGNLTPIKIPHSFDQIKSKLGDAPFYHLRIQCNYPTALLNLASGIPYLHVGWVFAEHTDIFVNNELRLSFEGIEKPTLPISKADFRYEFFTVEFQMSSKKLARFGLSGLAPLVIAPDTTSNFRIFGLETSMQNTTNLYVILPVLTLGLVLSFGWFYGIRSRLMITTFFFFVMSLAAFSFQLFGDFYPWDISTTFRLSKPFHVSKWLAFLLFGMELIQYRPKLIPKLMLGILALIVIEIILVAKLSDPTSFVQNMMRTTRWVSILFTGFLFSVAWKSVRKKSNPTQRPVFLAFIFLSTVSGAVLIGDSFIDYFRIPVNISHYLDLFMPLFVGGLLLYSLGLSEKNYQDERTKRIIIEQDLSLAHDIQESLAPPPNYFNKGGVSINTYQIKHSAVAGDWMTFREMPNGDHVLIVADATGKGVQAALIVHAVQSLWADVLQDATFDAATWLERVNRTLFTLGQRKPHSMTMGIVLISKAKIEYYCAGHVPLFVVNQETKAVTPMITQNGVLGLSETAKIKPAILRYEPGQNLNLLLGTDGVFDKGSRTTKRSVLALLDSIAARGTDALNDVDVIDDKTLIIAATNAGENRAA